MNFLNTMIMIQYVYLCILKKMKHCIENRILKREYPVYFDETPTFNNDENNYETMTHRLSEDLKTDQPKEKRPKNDFSDTNIKNENKKDYCSDYQKNIEQNENEIRKVELSRDKICDDNLNFFKKLIDHFTQFLNEKITNKKVRKYYTLKIAEISSNHRFLIAKKTGYLSYDSIFEPFNFGLIKILDNALLNFSKDSNFNLDEYEKFNDQLFGRLNSIERIIEFRNDLNELDFDVKKFLFYAELTKLSQYFPKIPELMVLGGGIVCKTMFDLQLISIYFMKLLLERENTEEVKVFVLFLIKKIFSSSKRNALDFFSAYDFLTCCSVYRNIIHYFNYNVILYEMYPLARANLKRRINKNINEYYFIYSDYIQIRSGFIAFLCQQIIFLEYTNVKKEEIRNFMILIKNFIDQKDDCTVCKILNFFKKLENLFKKQ